jgi:hypothetical protein
MPKSGRLPDFVTEFTHFLPMNKKKKPRALILQGFVACFVCTKSAPNYKEYEKYVE